MLIPTTTLLIAYQPPYIQKVDISGAVVHIPGVSSILETFRSKLAVVQIPILILALEIIALILLFVGMMTLLLVDRQADTIALIRSRGASRGQVFGAFMTQSIMLSLIALIIGPLLAIACVYFMTDRLLPPAAQDAVNVISNAPLQALLSIKWYAIGAAIVVIATMAFTLYRASRVDVWSTANQASPSARRPLWQRLNLDLFVGAHSACRLWYLCLFDQHRGPSRSTNADTRGVAPGIASSRIPVTGYRAVISTFLACRVTFCIQTCDAWS